jgi:hypothetical protein
MQPIQLAIPQCLFQALIELVFHGTLLRYKILRMEALLL